MSRRTTSSIIAVVLLVALFGLAAVLPVPYVTMSPGPTLDVLAEKRGEEIVQIDGERSYPTKGRLELTTISVTAPDRELGLAEVLGAWFDRTRAVYPRDSFYAPEQTAEDVEIQSDVEMVSSQDAAIAAALTELGYRLDTSTQVLSVTEGGPADGKLRPRDQLVSVDGATVRDSESVVDAVERAGVGTDVRFQVRRSGEPRTVTVRAQQSEDEPGKARVGVTVGTGYDFPFDVDVNIDDRIGGPSAGLIFALAVYDNLTPGALTGGRHISGTGTIRADGTVEPIGGIQQKIVAAADNGADLFLVPEDNCDSALDAPVEEDEIELVKAPTLRTAVGALKAFADDQIADLPRCG